jgi:hypothetical protein
MVAASRSSFLALAFCAALSGLSPAPALSATPALFDTPAKILRLPLAGDPANPGAKAQLSCFYYPHFMVKEVDLGELGAEQLSLIPIAAGQKKPTCVRANVPTEMVVSPDDWTGYFWGVKGSYVFFSAGDGWNGGMGFVIFAAGEAKKIFEDAAKTWRSIKLTASGLSMRYQRVYEAPCSLLADQAACWKQIGQDTGITDANAPDCTAAYALEQKRTPAFATQVLSDPTVFDYDVTTAIIATAIKATPDSGKVLNCRPAD